MTGIVVIVLRGPGPANALSSVLPGEIEMLP